MQTWSLTFQFPKKKIIEMFQIVWVGEFNHSKQKDESNSETPSSNVCYGVKFDEDIDMEHLSYQNQDGRRDS